MGRGQGLTPDDRLSAGVNGHWALPKRSSGSPDGHSWQPAATLRRYVGKAGWLPEATPPGSTSSDDQARRPSISKQCGPEFILLAAVSRDHHRRADRPPERGPGSRRTASAVPDLLRALPAPGARPHRLRPGLGRDLHRPRRPGLPVRAVAAVAVLTSQLKWVGPRPGDLIAVRRLASAVVPPGAPTPTGAWSASGSAPGTGPTSTGATRAPGPRSSE